MGKDIESGIEHVANEVVLQIGNTQKWNDMFFGTCQECR